MQHRAGTTSGWSCRRNRRCITEDVTSDKHGTGTQLFLFSFEILSCRDEAEGASFMDRNMIGFVALDQVLWRVLGRMVHVALESGDLFDDDAANPAGFNISGIRECGFSCVHRGAVDRRERSLFASIR
jgi:hypothetical protein